MPTNSSPRIPLGRSVLKTPSSPPPPPNPFSSELVQKSNLSGRRHRFIHTLLIPSHASSFFFFGLHPLPQPCPPLIIPQFDHSPAARNFFFFFFFEIFMFPPVVSFHCINLFCTFFHRDMSPNVVFVSVHLVFAHSFL